MKTSLAIAVCPGCGKRYGRRARKCRHCAYEMNGPPIQRATIQAMLDGATAGICNDVDLAMYTRAVIAAVRAYDAQQKGEQP